MSVLIEKPPCPTLAEFDVIAEAERAGGGTAYVVFQHRHGSGARRAAELLGSGALGHPQVAVCETLWYRPDSYFDPAWRGTWSGEGGGPTLGHGIHQIDLLLHLLDRGITWTATAGWRDRWSLRTCHWPWSGSRTAPSPRWSTACCHPASSAGSGSTPPLARWRSTTCTGIATRTGRSSPPECCGGGDARQGPGPARHDRRAARFHAAGVGRCERCLGGQRRHRRTEQPRRSDHPVGRRPALPDALIRPPWPAPGARLSSSAGVRLALLGKGILRDELVLATPSTPT